MSIYNKKTLIVILLLTIIISFMFFLVTKKDNYNKDDLYENKIADHQHDASDKNYGVASNNPIAKRVGEKILKDGGNAVDASMGVSYALAITEPHSSGLGGGGAMLAYDGQENVAPKQWQYKDISSFNYKQKDQVGVPGFVRGIDDAHNEAGKMDKKKVMNYVIPLAEEGFEVDSELERSLKLYGSDVDRDSPFFDGAQTKREGDVIKQPALAKTLKGIRDNGPDYFYDKVGKSVSKQMDNKLTEKDFQSYKTEKKEPVSTQYLNNTVYAASNPLGGTLMLQGLKIDEATNSQTASNDRLDYITGILKSRNLMYGNRDIVNGQDEDYDEYLSQGYILDKLNKINVSSDFNTNNVDNTSTTHFVVVDKNGEIASTTNTLASFFGSGDYMKEGFYMNDSLGNFSSDPASPNYGEKHKQPRSFTSPSIIVGPDYYMGIGTPGGNKIPTTLNEVIIDYLRGDGTLQESIDKPRFYNDNGKVFYENATSKQDIDIFNSLGFETEEKRNDPNFGSVQAAVYNKNDKTVEIGHDVGNR
ncbi:MULTISPECIES: gamma-glutamyltransferase [Staphylococcus]|jgi:gamma-glutamyltranspeptidase/glutathione hydrolase|uniref:Gamma-glutamyltransferase n=1 Tax=Staphylococcus nepalensis TaxID=214473 RepID=A0A291JIJ3_9STAP|nr:MULTISPECIES: gamma-glutamyltransferase [Staphylococcus]VDG66137.1 putative gamma-glutamyltranspeptidase [Lacrimispora indolis]ATH59227.1 gamma-glutamyltranspeptidase [Staphylococcus nepalensis]ATH64319.1 gamma-glutamyltranspeptidase [Staphylococcus nepalensis]AWI43678.1 gamma-glutamyltranspeptidase [Staphylococcus nepalensis]MBO1205528.1 gamma-glutamyltransferase [Staphylococcus nepalensis]